MFIRLTKLLLIFEILQKMVVVFTCILVVSSEALAVRRMTRRLCYISNPEMDRSSLLYHKTLNEPNSLKFFVEICKPPWREEYGRKNDKGYRLGPTQ